MADSTTSSLTALIAELTQIAATYVPSTSHDAAAQAPKAALINLAKKIQYSLMDPGQMVQAHSLQMAEQVSVRTLLDLKVFEQFPEQGQTISVQALSDKTGAQAALLGKCV